MGSLEIQDVFEPYFDRDGKQVERRQSLEIVALKRRYVRVMRRGEATPRDTEIQIHVARDVEHKG